MDRSGGIRLSLYPPWEGGRPGNGQTGLASPWGWENLPRLWSRKPGQGQMVLASLVVLVGSRLPHKLSRWTDYQYWLNIWAFIQFLLICLDFLEAFPAFPHSSPSLFAAFSEAHPRFFCSFSVLAFPCSRLRLQASSENMAQKFVPQLP